MGKEDGGLAHHGVECLKGIDWDNTRGAVKENGQRQRKVHEGIGSLREKQQGENVLSNFDQLEAWKSLRLGYFDTDRK